MESLSGTATERLNMRTAKARFKAGPDRRVAKRAPKGAVAIPDTAKTNTTAPSAVSKDDGKWGLYAAAPDTPVAATAAKLVPCAACCERRNQGPVSMGMSNKAPPRPAKEVINPHPAPTLKAWIDCSAWGNWSTRAGGGSTGGIFGTNPDSPTPYSCHLASSIPASTATSSSRTSYRQATSLRE
eukprot:scaffold591_cov176-Amphora_coffeaeformis.AAC.5